MGRLCELVNRVPAAVIVGPCVIGKSWALPAASRTHTPALVTLVDVLTLIVVTAETVVPETVTEAVAAVIGAPAADAAGVKASIGTSDARMTAAVREPWTANLRKVPLSVENRRPALTGG